jgi:hypothetical protein
MSQYIKNYGIIAAPLHALTKKVVAFPKPWKENEVYSKGVHGAQGGNIGL